MREAWQFELLPSILLGLFTKRHKAWEDKIIIPEVCLPFPTVSLTWQCSDILLILLRIHEKQAAGTLCRWTIRLCHCGITLWLPVAVPKSGCPPAEALGGKQPVPHSMIWEAQPGCWWSALLKHTFAFGEGKEWGRGWDMGSFSALTYLWARIQNKSLLRGGCSPTYPALPICIVPRYFSCTLTATLCI